MVIVVNLASLVVLALMVLLLPQLLLLLHFRYNNKNIRRCRKSFRNIVRLAFLVRHDLRLRSSLRVDLDFRLDLLLLLRYLLLVARTIDVDVGVVDLFLLLLVRRLAAGRERQ